MTCTGRPMSQTAAANRPGTRSSMPSSDPSRVSSPTASRPHAARGGVTGTALVGLQVHQILVARLDPLGEQATSIDLALRGGGQQLAPEPPPGGDLDPREVLRHEVTQFVNGQIR